MREAILSLKNLSFQYYAQAEPTLHDLNLEIYPGEKVLILGQSGSGKSTLAHLINGLIPHYYKGEITGEISLYGQDLTQSSLVDISKKVGTVLQDSDGQFIGLTVAEDIAFCMENACVPQNEMYQRVEKAARAVGIAHLLTETPQDLSGGQKQRVTVAGVLVDEVDVLLFDEPLASLDPASGRQTIELIDHLHKDLKKTIIIIEHRLEDVLHRDVDRVILMSEGRIVANTTPDELLASGILPEHGIREPLYISALRLAGSENISQNSQVTGVKASDLPASVETITPRAELIATCQDWAKENLSPYSPQETLLEVSGLDFSIDGKQILKNINFTIPKGQILSICGSNGAGKSTLSKLICGFGKIDSGKITLANEDITDWHIARRGEKIGFVIQNPNQMISKTMIIDEVALGLANLKTELNLSRAEKDQRIEKALKTCGLWKFRNWPVSALSFGQKKRVTIASILVSDPDIIILDEPTAGQDWAHYTEIMDFLRTLNQSGKTIILVTHDMHLALEYTQRTVVMHEGQIIADDTPARILSSQTITEKANLVTTSLDRFARRFNISPIEGFITAFIEREQKWRQKVLEV